MPWLLSLLSRDLGQTCRGSASVAVHCAGFHNLVIRLQYGERMRAMTGGEQRHPLVKFAVQGQGIICHAAFIRSPRVVLPHEPTDRLGVDTADRQAYLGHEPAEPGHRVRRVRWAGPTIGPSWLFCGGVAKSSKPEDLKNISGVQITRGQAAILDLAARDLGVKQIAKQLGVSVPTVKTQLQRFYRANGLHSRAGAVALWVGTRRGR